MIAGVSQATMPRRDLYHDCVRRALVRDGWTITHDPLIMPFRGRDLYIVLGAEAALGAEKAGEKIAVEIKTFGGSSETQDLERALGQYRVYRFLLSRHDPERVCFLAITLRVYEQIFVDPDVLALIAAEDVRLLVFDPHQEVIEKWITAPP
jgi:hypothetical protein